MDPNGNPQDFPPADSHQSFASNPPRGRAQGHYQGPYPTSNARARPRGDFRGRGRHSYNRRGGGSHRQQQEQPLDGNASQATTSNYGNRNFRGYFRASMLEDPWARLTPMKVPENGTTLLFDATSQ